MHARSLSPCIVTPVVEAPRDFCVRHFAARVVFDCGWYVSPELGEAGPSSALQFMAPQSGQPACNPAGLTCNIDVVDVDAEFTALTAAGLVPVMPLEDHPWGDRGFTVDDPNGLTLYLYSPREPSPRFQAAFKA